MPQARSGGSRSSSGAKGSSSKRSSSSSARKSTGSRSSSSRSSSARSSSSRSQASKSSGASSSAAADARLEAAAQRLRKLNERIIESGKQAGEGALTNYEKALKMIAGTIERGPGSSDVEWISNLATAQAKFIRDVTNAWTSAARDMLK
ncbi:MAG: hypothetical protein ACJ76X_18170 [Solirubrobacteraceae bacterium]